MGFKFLEEIAKVIQEDIENSYHSKEWEEIYQRLEKERTRKKKNTASAKKKSFKYYLDNFLDEDMSLKDLKDLSEYINLYDKGKISFSDYLVKKKEAEKLYKKKAKIKDDIKESSIDKFSHEGIGSGKEGIGSGSEGRDIKREEKKIIATGLDKKRADSYKIDNDVYSNYPNPLNDLKNKNSKKELRKAIIYSQILGRPKSKLR